VSLFRSAAFVAADLNAGTGVAPELDEFLGFRPAFTGFGFFFSCGLRRSGCSFVTLGMIEYVGDEM
jgi:hypothetical protein